MCFGEHPDPNAVCFGGVSCNGKKNATISVKRSHTISTNNRQQRTSHHVTVDNPPHIVHAKSKAANQPQHTQDRIEEATDRWRQKKKKRQPP